MRGFLKAIIVVCAVGILMVVGAVTLLDSPVQSTSEPSSTSAPAPTIVVQTTPPPSTAPEPELPDEPQPSSFRIEEVIAECDAGEGFAVSALPLGADWRTTERGVYNYSPVTITCVVGGASDGLSYEWSATDGQIDGSGDTIVWTAPAYGARVVVTVVVQDDAGRKESATMTFRVATCDCIFNRY